MTTITELGNNLATLQQRLLDKRQRLLDERERLFKRHENDLEKHMADAERALNTSVDFIEREIADIDATIEVPMAAPDLKIAAE